MKRINFLITCMLVLFGISTEIALAGDQCATLSRNLRFGDKGEDVLLLQRVLNANTETRIATTGPGSPGNETTFFGTRTAQAVARFQEAHREEVLTPVGLTRGTGYVGTFTRKRIQAYCATTAALGSVPTTSQTVRPVESQAGYGKSRPSTKPTQPSTTVSSTVVPINSASAATALNNQSVASPAAEKLELKYLSTYEVSPGGKITLFANGLTLSGNVVHIGGTQTTVPPTKLGVLDVVIPSNVTPGNNEIWISNSRGVSRKTFVIIKKVGSIDPEITSVTPTEGANGTLVTVTGKGFLPTGNSIIGSGARVNGLNSSDGKTLQFNISLDMLSGVSAPTKGVSLPYWFYVANENGISEARSFIIKI